MLQRLEQTQTEIQTQQLSALQIVYARLLELPVADLAARVQNEMVDNAALEEADRDEFPDRGQEEPEGDETAAAGNDSNDGETGGEELLGDYLTDDDVPEYLKARADAVREQYEVPQADSVSFYENLRDQISEYNLTDREREVMEYLIGSLDGDGFLRKDLHTLSDELAVYHNIDVTAEELERLLSVLHRFEPRGIGAQSLQECLRLQLEDPERRSHYDRLALKVVNRCFKDFVARKWDAVMRRLKIDEETLKHVRYVLTHLNPLPGSALSENMQAAAPTVLPDFFVTAADNGDMVVTLNNGDIPELRVSPSFKESIREYSAHRSRMTREQRETYTYVKNKVESANIFIGLLKRRHQTLLAVMQAIVDLQRPFFDDDDESLLSPMTQKEVAQKAGLDISTVSRVTGSKYVQTLYGIYPLKYFFSSQFTAEDGGEISTRQVKVAMTEILAAEDKHCPLTDDGLAEALREKGFRVARRTVAKYREMMGIPTARLRKD